MRLRSFGPHELCGRWDYFWARWRVYRFYCFLNDSCDGIITALLFELAKCDLHSKEVVSFVNWINVVGVIEVGVKIYSLQLIEACLALLIDYIIVPQDSKTILYSYWLRFGILFLWDLCPQLLTFPGVSEFIAWLIISLCPMFTMSGKWFSKWWKIIFICLFFWERIHRFVSQGSFEVVIWIVPRLSALLAQEMSSFNCNVFCLIGCYLILFVLGMCALNCELNFRFSKILVTWLFLLVSCSLWGATFSCVTKLVLVRLFLLRKD